MEQIIIRISDMEVGEIVRSSFGIDYKIEEKDEDNCKCKNLSTGKITTIKSNTSIRRVIKNGTSINYMNI